MKTLNTTIKNAVNRTVGQAKRPVRAAAFLAASLLISPVLQGSMPCGPQIELPAGDAPAVETPEIAKPVVDMPIEPVTSEIEAGAIAVIETAGIVNGDLAEIPAGKLVEIEAAAFVVIDAANIATCELENAARIEAASAAVIGGAIATNNEAGKIAEPEEFKPAEPTEPAAPIAPPAPPAVVVEEKPAISEPPVVVAEEKPAVLPEPILPDEPELPKPADSVFAPVTPVGLAEAPKPVAAPTTAPSVAVAVAPTVPVIAPAPATRPVEAVGILEGMPADGRITLLVGRAMVIKSRVPYSRVAFSQPDVAKDNELPDGLLITGLKAGATQLIVWDKNEKSQVLEIVVEADLNALTDLVKKNFPGTEVQLSSANGTVVVRGRVPSLQVADQITQLLSAYGKVLNFLEMSGGQQVMMQVRFAEVSRSATTALGVNFGFADGHAAQGANNNPGGGPYSIMEGVGQLTRSVGANVTLFGGGRIGSTEFDVFISALRNNNLLRVLAEPNLSTVSGKEAQFLAGGEFPIPVPQAGGSGNSAITVEYKQFGVRLSFTPVVLGDGKIRLTGTAEVSDLDFTRSVAISGFSIPSLTKRTVTTTIEVSEGQTFAVAGLLQNRMTSSKQAVPLLGDVPVLGALFRSVRYERSETELVILVTPRLVEGMNPKQVPELPGERWQYPSEADLFLNQYLGGPARDSANKPGPVMFRGPYGFVPATPTGTARPTPAVTSVQSER